MFSKSKDKKKQVISGAVERNTIGKNTKIIGDLVSDGDFRIDGTLEGTLKTKGRVIIGKEGFIKGNVECIDADVEGKFSGEFTVVDTLTAKSTAHITGDVTVGRISTEPGASFNATCNMKGAVKELGKDTNGKQQAKKGKTA